MLLTKTLKILTTISIVSYQGIATAEQLYGDISSAIDDGNLLMVRYNKTSQTVVGSNPNGYTECSAKWPCKIMIKHYRAPGVPLSETTLNKCEGSSSRGLQDCLNEVLNVGLHMFVSRPIKNGVQLQVWYTYPHTQLTQLKGNYITISRPVPTKCTLQNSNTITLPTMTPGENIKFTSNDLKITCTNSANVKITTSRQIEFTPGAIAQITLPSGNMSVPANNSTPVPLVFDTTVSPTSDAGTYSKSLVVTAEIQ